MYHMHRRNPKQLTLLTQIVDKENVVNLNLYTLNIMQINIVNLGMLMLKQY